MTKIFRVGLHRDLQSICSKLPRQKSPSSSSSSRCRSLSNGMREDTGIRIVDVLVNVNALWDHMES